MSRLMLMTLSVLLLATVVVAPASARSRREKSQHSWDSLKKLRVGEEIQVVYQEEQYLNGRFQGFTPDSISVQWGTVNRHEETILRQDVLRVIASRPSARFKNTLIGLGGGALAGVSILGEADLSGTDGSALLIVPVIAVIGAIAGGLSAPDATIYEALGDEAPRLVDRTTSKTKQATKPVPAATSSSGPLFGCSRCESVEINRRGLY